MPPFDDDLAAIDAVSQLAAAEALPIVRKALAHRNNLIVSRAAKHSLRLDLRTLTPELAAAFQRFMPPADAVKIDPQCWAKNELSRTLAAFEYQDAALFLSGLQHHQHEPTWGGTTDTAGALRGTCALALVQCRDLASPILLRHLTPLFDDADLPVRINAARAIEQVGSDSAALLLRLRAELGLIGRDNEDPDLLAACIGGVLRLDGIPALPWVAAFLARQDELSNEAAFVLAEHRSIEALTYLQKAFTAASVSRRDTADLRETLLAAIASTRLPEATAWLLQLISTQTLYAKQAAKALCNANPTPELAAQLEALGRPCV
jgi:HEAT repeat protein